MEKSILNLIIQNPLNLRNFLLLFYLAPDTPRPFWHTDQFRLKQFKHVHKLIPFQSLTIYFFKFLYQVLGRFNRRIIQAWKSELLWFQWRCIDFFMWTWVKRLNAWQMKVIFVVLLLGPLEYWLRFRGF